jgi:signal peptidase I
MRALARLNTLWRDYRSTVLFLMLALCFRSAWADWVTVPTGSMNPTIIEGDLLLVDKHVFGLRVPFTRLHLTDGEAPSRGDIVVFDSPADGISLVKRVIGVPGDIIELDNDRLIVNGHAARYTPGDVRRLRALLTSTAALHPVVLHETGVDRPHDVLLLPERPALRSMGPVTVPDGMYFMMGDSRDNSADSRYFGFVPRRQIIGRATRVAISFDPERHYLPRTARLLAPLS